MYVFVSVQTKVIFKMHVVVGTHQWRRRQSKRWNGCASNLETLDVGRAVNGAEARGPCWDLRRALVGPLRPGQT